MLLSISILYVSFIITLLILHKKLDAKFKKELEEEEIQ